MSRIFEELLRKRKIGDSFLKPEYGVGPVYLPDIEKAVERIKTALKRREKVLIYGDYDVDGVTATALMVDVLGLVGIKDVLTMLPNRFLDGYGMSERCVKFAVEQGVKLVITVDCGSNNNEVIRKLAEAGIDVVVTDHHEVLGDLPEAVAVVNPKRSDFVASEISENFEGGEGRYGVEELRTLAGVGVAFIVAKALVKAGMIPEGQEKWLLDLVLIGTICDSMCLAGINRELCFYGMKVLERTRRVGLLELIRAARVTKINGYAVGFQIGPRLNAAGRMETADIALDLLTSKSRAEAARLAAKLSQLNDKRKKCQDNAVEEIVAMEGVDEQPVIVVRGKWSEGVIGIVAGKLAEKYKKPAFVLTEAENVFDEDGDGVVGEDEAVLKGSGRTFGEFNLAEALKYCQGAILGGGGHAEACGLKVLSKDFEKFRARVNEYYASLNLAQQVEEVREDVVVDNVAEMTPELLLELAQLEPYGNGNLEPVFRLTRASVLDVRPMGQRGEHLMIRVGDGGASQIKLVAFYAEGEWFNMEKGSVHEFWVRLAKNEWQGRVEVEGMVVRVD